jgi:hypothetical protein
MQKYASQGWLTKVTISGILISLFTISGFIPAINSAPIDGISQNINFFTANSRNMQAFFNVGVECIYLTEPVNGNMSKPPSSSKEVIPLCHASYAFHTDSLYAVTDLYFLDKIPRKSFQQVCLVLDIPPPII